MTQWRVCRAQHDSVRNAVVADVTSHIGQLCDRRHLTCSVERIHDAGAVQCSPALVGALSAAVKESEQVSMHTNYIYRVALHLIIRCFHSVSGPGYLTLIPIIM